MKRLLPAFHFVRRFVCNRRKHRNRLAAPGDCDGLARLNGNEALRQMRLRLECPNFTHGDLYLTVL